MEENVVPADPEAMSIIDASFEVRDILHVSIEDLPADCAVNMVMLRADVVEAVRTADHLHFADLAALCELVQVPVHRRPADIGMAPDYDLIDLFGGRMALQLPDGIQDE